MEYLRAYLLDILIIATLPSRGRIFGNKADQPGGLQTLI